MRKNRQKEVTKTSLLVIFKHKHNYS